MTPANRPSLFGWLVCLALALSACLPATWTQLVPEE